MARSSCHNVLPCVETWKKDLLLIHTSQHRAEWSCSGVQREVFLKIRAELSWKAGAGVQSHTCLPGSQVLSINQYPAWLIPPWSPSPPPALQILCIPWIASLPELLRLRVNKTQTWVHAALSLWREGRRKQNAEHTDNAVALPWVFLKAIDFLSQLFTEITAWPSGWLRCIFVYTCSLVSLYYHIIHTCQFSASLSPLEADTQVSFIKTKLQ